MSRPVDAVHADLMSLLPTGWAWSRASGRVLPAVVRVIAQAIARVEAQVDDLMTEIDPASATMLLADYERVLGPDPCGLDVADAPVGLRRVQAWRRWTWAGGAAVAWFVTVAAAYGETISIETYRPVVCGDELGASDLIVSPEQYVWTIRLGLTWERPAICGDQVCGDYLGEIGLSPIECLVRRWAPAHTIPVFDYSGA